MSPGTTSSTICSPTDQATATEYRVTLKGRTRRELERLGKVDRKSAELLAAAIGHLQLEPFGNGAKKVRGSNDTWRVKANHHLRVVYEVDGNDVVVTYAGQREGAYS